jgi:hypothetical protein
MRKYLLIFIALFPLFGFADIELLEGGAEGPTHIDPSTNSALIHYSQTVPGQLKVTYRYPKDANGKPINNFYVIERKNANNEIETVQEISQDINCEELKKDISIITCNGYSALEVLLNEPEGTPGPAQLKSVTMPLDSPDLQAALKAASPDNQFLIIRDAKSPKGIVASMLDKSLCGLDRKQVDLNGPWSDPKFPSQIYTSNRERGFFIGDHTFYFFDEKKAMWCYHFLPDLPNTAPICTKDFNNKTFRIDFGYKNSTDTVNKGVVKLSVDANGVPSAAIGTGTLPLPQPAATAARAALLMDPSKPFISVQFPKTEAGVPNTTFQAFDKLNGTPGRTLIVSPSYTMGANFNDRAICDASACLSPVSQITPSADNSSSRLCKKNDSVLDLNNKTKDQNALCYSCNGVTPGACSSTKSLINTHNYGSLMNQLNNCKGAIRPTSVDPGSTGVGQ